MNPLSAKAKDFSETPGVSKSREHHVASSTFWFKNDNNMKTVISFLNYWKIKNNLDVNLTATSYSINGKLLEREKVTFKKGKVKNLYPLKSKFGEGSVEIKIESKTNLRIPYAAIVAIYETKYGLSAVHSYSRFYYENEPIFNKGNEGSWTIRDSEKISSFCVFHNGSKTQPSQKQKIIIQNEKGELLNSQINIPKIPPFGTVKINLKDHIKNLSSFLDGGIGVASSIHEVQNSFARMLIGNESIRKGYDLQVTHSNFNYKILGSDFLKKGKNKVLKPYPGAINKYSEFIVYPHLVSGNYEASIGKKKYKLTYNKNIVRIPVEKKSRVLNFSSHTHQMPSRIQLGLVTRSNEDRIPNEVAFSAMNSIEPFKRFHWGVCGIGKNIDTKIIILDLMGLNADQTVKKEVIISLYSSKNEKIMQKTISETQVKGYTEGTSIYNIFEDLEKPEHNTYEYYSVFSHYGGFLCYSQMQNQHGSIALEHSF